MKYQELTQVKKDELLELVKESTTYSVGDKTYYVGGSRIHDHHNEDSDWDIIVSVEDQDYYATGMAGELHNTQEWDNMRVRIHFAKNSRGGMWGGYELPLLNMETGEYIDGKDLAKYLEENKPGRL